MIIIDSIEVGRITSFSMQEVLPPGSPVPAAVRVPVIVETWREDFNMTTNIVFEDGGQWAIYDGHLIHHRLRNMDEAAELFAEKPGLFEFVRRRRSRYARRT